MSKILTIVRHEVYITLKRRAYLLMTFGVPVLAAVAVLVFTLMNQDKEQKGPSDLFKWPDKPIGYVDHSGVLEPPEAWIPELLAILEQSLAVLPTGNEQLEESRTSVEHLIAELEQVSEHIISYPDEDSARQGVQTGALDSFYLVAADYMQTGNVTRIAPQIELSTVDRNPFKSYLFLQLLSQNPEEFSQVSFALYRLTSGARMIEHQLDTSGLEKTTVDRESGANFILVYGFGLIWLMSTFISSGYLLQSVVHEKENRMIEVVLSSLRPIQLLAGKVLGQGMMGLLQAMVWLVAGWGLFNLAVGEIANFSGDPIPAYKIALAVVYFVGGFMLLATVYAGIGAVSSNLREGPQYASFITMPAIVPMFFLISFMESPNATLPVVLSLIPITAPLGMIQRIAITSVPLWQLALSILSMGVSIAGTLWFAAKLFHVNTLLAGSPPNFKQIIKLLRQA